MALDALDDDALIYIFSFLKPPEIISTRKTCRRLWAVSNLRIVWTNACDRYILQKGYPFSNQPLASMSIQELEQRTCHAFRLASRWTSGRLSPRRTLFVESTSNSPVSDVRFLPGRSGDWIITVSKGIWDLLTVWDLTSEPRKACEWSSRGALFNGITLNTDPESDAILAVSVLNDGERNVHLLSLRSDRNGVFSLQVILTKFSNMKPTTLHGDVLALSDEVAESVIWNWRLQTSAVLRQSSSDADPWQPNRIIQIVSAHRSIVVVRASSIHLFPEPELTESPQTYHPIAQHSFGWIDGVCVTPTGSCLSILLRGESDDPWSTGLHSLDYYTLQAAAAADADVDDDNGQSGPPYIFPPYLTAKVPAARGSLRCRKVVLGPCGTAAWIQPQDRAVVGLAWGAEDEYSHRVVRPESGHESLMVAAFPGPLALDEWSDSGVTDTRSYAVCPNALNDWAALDYDEEIGRIVLCSSFGRVTVLEL